MNKELNIGRLFATVGAIVVVAGIATPTERVPIIFVGLAFVLCGLFLYGFMRERR